MKRFKNLVIGGIENKVFNLILITMILLTAAYLTVSAVHGNMLTQLSGESSERQQAAIGETTSEVMDQVVIQSLGRSNRTEASIANAMFEEARDRVAFLVDCAEKRLSGQEEASASLPASEPSRDGAWTATFIYADGVDASDPAIASRVERLSGLSGMMISMCPNLGAANMYIALPEGVHLSVNDDPDSWIVDGVQRSYDPRTRNWYRLAAQADGPIFTEGEYDANTGEYCVECAAPVRDRDGGLLAVVGTDLYLDDMRRVMQEMSVEGEFQLLINQSGRAVLEPQAASFPMSDEDRSGDVRQSGFGALSQIATEAIQGSATGVQQGQLRDGGYFITAAPIEATGWVLISAFSQEIARQPTSLMLEQNRQIQMEYTAIYREKTKKSKQTATVLLIAITALMLALALHLSRQIVRPLNLITQRISMLQEGNLEFRMEDAYRTGDEVEAMAQSFAQLSRKTVEYLETVKRVTAEKERISAELSLATRIQAAMLPHVFPPFPDRSEFDIYACMDPAKEVGGDFFDYFLVDDDHLAMVMADVSGKGVPAALFMMASKIILANNAMMGKSPAQILKDTNAAICSNNQEEMFVTVWLGILEISTGRLIASNAGHEYPVIRHSGDAFELFKDRHGFVIGGLAGVRYREYELQLMPGDVLFIYTDGVPEATNASGELFGTERMLTALNESSDIDPEQMLKRVRRAVDDFVGEAEQFDDLTMLCMKYMGRGGDA